MLQQRQPVPGRNLVPCSEPRCCVLQLLWCWWVLSIYHENPCFWPGCAHAEFFWIYTLGQRNKNQLPVSRPPWIWGLPCLIAIWHLIWRPDLGNSCYSSSGLSTINHVRRQQRYLQQEILQLVAGVCRNSPWTCSPRKVLHLPVWVQGSLGTEAWEELFDSRRAPR